MNIVFRVDASLHIGSGHVMRCLTLANALRNRGIDCHFICADLPGHLALEIQAQGFGCTLISGYRTDNIENTWPKNRQQQHAQTCLQILDSRPDWLIIDHYGLDVGFEEIIQQEHIRVIVIDDLANRQHHTHILLDTNYFPNASLRYKGLVSSDCTLLTGPRYALMRPEFNALRAQGLMRDGDLENILVFFGGMDKDNVTATALHALQIFMQQQMVHVDVVIGAQNPYGHEIKRLCAQSSLFFLHIQTPHMEQLMLQADLTLGAGGSTHWERCMLGLPSIVCALAPNQQSVTEHLAAQGACHYLGIGQALTVDDWYKSLNRIQRDDLCSMSHAAQDIMDEHDGCQRVIDALLADNVFCRQRSIE